MKNLMAVVRNDGAIIKPDAPLLPIDDLYKSDALGEKAPMVATAATSFGDLQVNYVFAYSRQPSESRVTATLHSLGITGPVFAYDWVTHKGQVIPADGSVTMAFTDGWAYQVLSPINRNGLALLGDTEKITSLGRARFASVKDDGALSATIRFTSGEPIQNVTGYASHHPTIKAALRQDREREL